MNTSMNMNTASSISEANQFSLLKKLVSNVAYHMNLFSRIMRKEQPLHINNQPVVIRPARINQQSTVSQANLYQASYSVQNTQPDNGRQNTAHHPPPQIETRTLHVTNLPCDISENHLELVFSQYGQVENIDIKRPRIIPGFAYAFLSYVNLDLANM